MCSQPRLLIIGLDGAAPGLINDWMASGLLPNFQTFARESARAPLRCTWPPHTATGWTSLFSGRLPGEHGIFQFWDCQDPHYGLRVMSRAEAACPVIWDGFARAGWSCGLVNLPMSHPPGPWSGYQMTWPLTPTIHFHKPPELLTDLASAGGLILPDIACMYDGASDYPERALGYIEARTRGLKFLMGERPVDVMAVVYPEIDRVCHHYWPQAKDTPELALRNSGVILDIYAAMDKAFGELVAMVDDQCTVLVVSDHGFGPGRRGLRLHCLLADLGWCVLSNQDQSHHSAPCSGARLDLQHPSDYRERIDWQKTSAYMPTPGCFGVNLNMEGRQSKGTVPPDKRAAMLAQLTLDLQAVIDPLTGRPLFEAVIPSGQAYKGPFSGNAPDLLLVPHDAGLMLLQDLNGPLWDGPGQSGLHRLEGVWMMRSPRMDAGERSLLPIECAANILMADLGLEPLSCNRPSAACAQAESGISATAWSAVGEDNLLTDTCRKTGRHAVAVSASPDRLADATEDDLIVERLRAMGYL